ncbi:MAG: hypothetical protein ACLP7P_18060 [Rhodomicrobium sp.]
MLSLALVWLVLTKSLPFALAPAAPDLALALDPGNPVALVVKARQISERLLAQSGVAQRPAEAQEPSASGEGDNTLDRLPKAASSGGPGEPLGDREAMRKEIARLASLALARDPLNAEAVRLLAETAGDDGRVRMLMEEAAGRSRRESAALFWLLNDSLYRKDYRNALDYADILLRTQPELSGYVVNYVAFMAQEPDGLPLVAGVLAKRPSWRGMFFASLPRSVQQIDVPLKLMTALKESGSPPSEKELAPYLDVLISKDRTDAAYNAWLQFLPPAELANLNLITNGDFESPPSGLPFDWRIARGLNAVAELVPSGSGGSEGLLHVSFGSGRVTFPELSQIILLAPGRYRLEGKLRGRIIAKRGLRWQLRCAGGAHRLLAETEMLMGESQEWRLFSLDAEVPESGDCIGQMLRLFHDSRSASEEFISGEVWFAGLRLRRAASLTAAEK